MSGLVRSIVVAVPLLALAGCAGAGTQTASVPARQHSTGGTGTAGGASATASGASARASGASATASGAGAGSRGYLNDGDNERVGDADGDNSADNDGDRSLDYLPSDYRADENSRYHDADDIGLVSFGRPAPAEEDRAVSTLVMRYYAMAAASKGAPACALLTRPLAVAVPSDYGAKGPSYLRGGKTCAAVLRLLFGHYHTQLAVPPVVTGVRVQGDLAYALLGSHTLPANYIIVRHEAHTWRLTQLLGNENALP